MDKLTELKNLKLLLDEGAITKNEFESLKAEILNPKVDVSDKIEEKENAELKKLNLLMNDGLLSENEFNKLKEELLNKQQQQQQQQQQPNVPLDIIATSDLVSLSEKIKEIADLNDGIYFLEDASLLKDFKPFGDVSGYSGWGGLAEGLGIKNAEKKIIRKTKSLNCNTVLITEFSSPMGGVKIEGKAYNIEY